MTATSHRKVFLIGSNVNFGPSQISKVNPCLVVPSLQAQQCEHADLIQNVHLDQQQLSAGGRLPRLRDFPRRDPGHHAGAGLLRGHHSHWRGAGGHHAGVRRGELPLHHQPRPLQAAQKPDQPAHRQPSRVGRAGGSDLLSLPARLLRGEAAVVGARPAALCLHQLPAHRLALRVHKRSPGHRRGQVGSPPGTQADNTEPLFVLRVNVPCENILGNGRSVYNVAESLPQRQHLELPLSGLPEAAQSEEN